MDINHNQAPALSLLSIMSSILSWITFADAQYVLSFAVTIVGMISGIFAMRYYYYAGNKMKNDKPDK